MVDTEELSGPVTGLTHAMETIGQHVVYHVEIEIAAEPAGDPDVFFRPLR